MKTVLEFALLGLGTGAIYGLGALGLVLVYRASRVINFASGAIGMVGTYLYWQLHDQHNWPFIAAFIPSIALCALLGALTETVIIRRLANASALAKLLATLGVLTALEAAVSLKFPQEEIVTESLPSARVTIFGVSLGEDRLLLFGIGLVLAVALGLFYRHTRFGMATSAVAENERSAACLSISPHRVAAANWAIGSALAGVAGILVVPLTGLSVEGVTLLVIPALAAGVVGDMRSFAVTFAAAEAIGIAQSEVSNYISTPGWVDAVPFIVIVLVLCLRGSALPTRGHISLKLPSVTTGKVRPTNVAGAAVLAVVWILLAPINWIDGTTTTLAYALILLSIVVVTGFAGQVSLAQYALAGMGAYVAGRLAASLGAPFEFAILAGVVAAIPIGVIVGLPALRARGTNLAIATLGLSVAIEAVLFDSANWTGGPNGTEIGIPRFFGMDMNTVTHPRRYAMLLLVFFLLVALAVLNIRRGSSGRRLLAVRANERGAASLGVNVVTTKLYAFALGSMIAALGGIMLAFTQRSIVYTTFSAFESVTLVGFSVIGGLGYATGPLYGGTFAPGGIGTTIGNLFGYDIQQYLLLASGVVLILVLLQSPDGIAPRTAEHWRLLVSALIERLRWATKRSKPPEGPDWSSVRAGAGASEPVSQPTTLRTEGLSVRFGGVKALVDVSLEVKPGEVVGLIGPNGAGKTTFVEAVTGFVQPEAGRVYLGEAPITSLPPRKRAALGLSRSFQDLELFEDMTVLENLLVASEARIWRTFLLDLVRPRANRLSPGAVAAVERFQLVDHLQTKISELSYGLRRLVAIARCLAAEPSVLLLDEPAAGLSDGETEDLHLLLRDLATRWHLAVLLIEHDVDLVMRSCDRIVVLNFGARIAEGRPAEIRSNAVVRASYLGVESEAETVPTSGSDAGATTAPAAAAIARQRPALTGSDPAAEASEILACRDLSAGYGATAVLKGMELSVRAGEVVVLLGPNGAGKTTTLLALSGAIPSAGTIVWKGSPTSLPLFRRAREGMGFVTEERSVFASMTTADNLRLGRGGVAKALELMPELEPLLKRRAGLLSGGEQQILTLARALATEPQLLLADELSVGLAPLVVRRLLAAIRDAADNGLGVLLVEQHVHEALEIADRAYVIRRGQVVMGGTASEMRGRLSDIEASYLSEEWLTQGAEAT
jgi:ABC-type branched-subunit amino acid transport system ATPase component/branched-subunit amino acid ABC-type transport system permease component